MLRGLLIELRISQHNIQMPEIWSKITRVQRAGEMWLILKGKDNQQMAILNYLDIKILR